MSAVKQQEFHETLIAYHPGVTTMWLAGLRTFSIQPHLDVENLTRARWFIGIAVWVGIGIACLLLYQLFGKWITLASFAYLAYSPFFLAQTRRVHTDALATTFILLTVLLFLIYCQNRQHHRYLIFSGVTFGLALLSKSYALILLLWLPWCFFLFRHEAKHTGGFSTYIAEGLCFLNCAAMMTILIWPVFWTLPFGVLSVYLFGTTYVLARGLKKKTISPASLSLWGAIAALSVTCLRGLQTVWLVLDRVGWALTTPHEVDHFFLGKVVADPGWLFYFFTLSIKSTPFVLPFAIGTIMFLGKHRREADFFQRFRIASAIGMVVILFTICLSLTSKKFPRYLLPVFPMLDVLAGMGLVYAVNWIGARLKNRHSRNAARIGSVAILLILTVAPVFALHPYYGTYYNLCWRGMDITKIITVGEASGLDIAAAYLNKKPNATQMSIQGSHLGTAFLRYYFKGTVYRADRNRVGDTKELRPADYEVVYIRDSQIGRVPQDGTRNGKLEHTITLNGIDLVWIYRIETP